MNFIVFSHLRWDFVFQRPQHLMTRCAKSHRVLFWEEPIFDASQSFLELRPATINLEVVVPHLPIGLSETESHQVQTLLLKDLLAARQIVDYVLWYYTPMALAFSRELESRAIIYDCMDELSLFKNAPHGLVEAEKELFSRADFVFTGGRSLYESKKHKHRSVHCFPSSIDQAFFASARRPQVEPEDQSQIPRPRLGYCGVIDERMDLTLVSAVAAARPEWHIVMVGPIVKIDQKDVPIGSNIHYLGPKSYSQLPGYLAGWEVGLLPFALNDSTRFISPTKTPEYLAAGLSVVSTAIRDVETPYGAKGVVSIAGSAAEFVSAIERGLQTRSSAKRLEKADKLLAQCSWDLTWNEMAKLIDSGVASFESQMTIDTAIPKKPAPVAFSMAAETGTI
jgi:UDP-galactopyranose mutase